MERGLCVEACVPARVDQGHRREELEVPASRYVSGSEPPRIHACMYTVTEPLAVLGTGKGRNGWM